MKEENSGLSCSYYEIEVDEPNLFHSDKDPYIAECGEISSALELTAEEANIFKEVWRTAAMRLGKKKHGHTQLRGYEKIFFYAKRALHKERHYNGK